MVSVKPGGSSQTTSVSVNTASETSTISAKTVDKQNTVQGINDLSKYYAELAKQYAEQAVIDVNNKINEAFENVAGVGNIRVTYRNEILSIENYTYEFEQAVSSDRWIINHNLNKRPSVVIVDSAGSVFEPAVEYVDNNTCIAEMLGATTGKAYLN